MAEIRAFLSHAHKDRKIGAVLKEKLHSYKIDVFLAHEDIEGGAEWMSQIYDEVQNCEIFLILLSENYHTAYFTDQETGMALCNKKPIIPICIDSTKPYGFMSKYQGLQCKSSFLDQNIKEIMELIIKHSKSGQDFLDFLISNLSSASSFNDAFDWASRLANFSKFTDQQLVTIAEGYFYNDQIYNSFMARPIVRNILYNNKKNLKKEIRDALKF